ncbi:MAG: DUF1194 domain-containing protein [Rickettsiales bacterium]|nr:DUF1194 domain-containing protein [Rickettsiales bacterium]
MTNIPKNFITPASIATIMILHTTTTYAQDVDVELQLLVDVSGSVSSSEYNLMMGGYADAFRNQSVMDIILDNSGDTYGNIAVQTVMWSGQNQQKSMTDWTLLDSVDSIFSYASTLENMNRAYSNATYVAEGIDFGSNLFATNGFNGTRNVIDISGDGYGYDYLYGDYSFFSGLDTATQRDVALAGGITTINGITLEGTYGLSGGQTLTEWYSTNVTGGENAFVIAADGFEDFENALVTKLSAEIEGGYIPIEATPSNPIDTAPVPIAGGGLAGLIMLLFVWLNQQKSLYWRRLC